MEKIFIACPISKYINNNEFINDEFKMFIESLYDICQRYSNKVFLALRREEYGKKLMKDTCTELDFEEMKTTNMVVAIPEDSKGTAVELGWASCMNKKIILILDCSKRYTPLIAGLNDITDTEIVWYKDILDKNVLNKVEKIIRKKCEE